MVLFGSCSTEGPNMCIRDCIKEIPDHSQFPSLLETAWHPAAFSSCLAQNGEQSSPRLNDSGAMSLKGMKCYLRANFALLRHTVKRLVGHGCVIHLFKYHLLQQSPSGACSGQSPDFQIAVWVYRWHVAYSSSAISS